MKSWIWLGIVLGGLLSALSWFGNVRRDLPHVTSVFPDLITLAALPVLVFLALWLVAHRYEASTRATLRRAGMIIVGIGAALFAVAHAVLGMVQFSQPSAFMLVVGFGMAFSGFLAVGWLSAWAASTWLLHAGGKR